VFEDAPAGVLAAKAACMRVIAVPEASERRLPAFAIADAVLGSLEEVDEALFERLEASLHASSTRLPAADAARVSSGGRVTA